MDNLDMLFDHIGQWNTPHPTYNLEVEHNGIHFLCTVILIHFGHSEVICLFLFQLPLMLILKDTPAVNMTIFMKIGALLDKYGKLEVLCYQYGELIPLVRHPFAD